MPWSGRSAADIEYSRPPPSGPSLYYSDESTRKLWITRLRLNRHHHTTGDCKAKDAISNETTAVEVAATSKVSSAGDTVASFVKAHWYWVLPLAALVIWRVVL
jgi:hypothetical protein